MRHVVPHTVICLIASFRCYGQTPAPAFEVATIRANDSQTPANIIQITPGSLNFRNATLNFVIRWAYDVTDSQFNGPAWISSTRFDIVAKTAAPADEARMRLMLQSMLADRFGVKVHRETQAMQIYAITIAKGGPKFQESTTEGPSEIERTNPMLLAAHHISMKEVADRISQEIGRPVVDATGLKGRYEIRMDVTPYVTRSAGGGEGQLDMMSILFTGFQDLLGLKLESRKDNVQILIVDHVEKSPTEN